MTPRRYKDWLYHLYSDYDLDQSDYVQLKFGFIRVKSTLEELDMNF